MEQRIENWNGWNIRFVNYNGEWWAVLKDICDALGLRTDKVADRLDASYLDKTNIISDNPSKGVTSKARKTQNMIIVNEFGIYEALFASRKLEARKFRMWSANVMRKLRQSVGLQGFEVMHMTDKDVQDAIDNILDTLYYDEEKKMLMRSVTVAGGDVEQVPLFEK